MTSGDLPPRFPDVLTRRVLETAMSISRDQQAQLIESAIKGEFNGLFLQFVSQWLQPRRVLMPHTPSFVSGPLCWLQMDLLSKVQT